MFQALPSTRSKEGFNPKRVSERTASHGLHFVQSLQNRRLSLHAKELTFYLAGGGGFPAKSLNKVPYLWKATICMAPCKNEATLHLSHGAFRVPRYMRTLQNKHILSAHEPNPRKNGWDFSLAAAVATDSLQKTALSRHPNQCWLFCMTNLPGLALCKKPQRLNRSDTVATATRPLATWGLSSASLPCEELIAVCNQVSQTLKPSQMSSNMFRDLSHVTMTPAYARRPPLRFAGRLCAQNGLGKHSQMALKSGMRLRRECS